MALVVNNDLQVKTAAELVKYLKDHPGCATIDGPAVRQLQAGKRAQRQRSSEKSSLNLWKIQALTQTLNTSNVDGPGLPRRIPYNGPILLAPYDAAWPVRYAFLKARIVAALQEKALLIEHVGSTSVPGLAAKPIIDIVLAVPDTTDEASYVPPLEAEGFALTLREPTWYEHRLLKPPAADVNLHVFSEGCVEIERMIVFRNHLRTHDGDRATYEATKRSLATRIWRHMQDYADAKSDVVETILGRAR